MVADGRLVWVIDGYTSTEPVPAGHASYEGINYLRNSVKVVIDAYDGTTTFYRTAEARSDRRRLRRGLRRPASRRSPRRQHRSRSTSATRSTSSTCNRKSGRPTTSATRGRSTTATTSGLWRRKKSTAGAQTVEPYFVTQQLPNETETEFALTVPFTPGGGQSRQNMTAWFAGTADSSGETRLRQYRYPRQVTVFGPMQIDAQIDQDPEISQQITLWNQSGTEVIRGNMLVIPVNDAMLYIQPALPAVTRFGRRRAEARAGDCRNQRTRRDATDTTRSDRRPRRPECGNGRRNRGRPG